MMREIKGVLVINVTNDTQFADAYNKLLDKLEVLAVENAVLKNKNAEAINRAKYHNILISN